MLSTVGVILHAAAVIVLLPLAVRSLATGSQPPKAGFLSRYYSAERYLTLFGDIFLVAISASAMLRLALHFGLVPAETPLEPVLQIVFAVSLLAFLVLLIKAVLKVHRRS